MKCEPVDQITSFECQLNFSGECRGQIRSRIELARAAFRRMSIVQYSGDLQLSLRVLLLLFRVFFTVSRLGLLKKVPQSALKILNGTAVKEF